MANSAPAADFASAAESTPAADSAPAVKIVSTDVTKALEAEASSSQPPQAKTELSVEEKYQLVRSIGEECVQEDELRNLLAEKPNPIAYDWFEPSGRMHIAQGVMKVINVNKLAAAGCTVKICIADWSAMAKNKMGGDKNQIETISKYFIEIWKAAGMQLENVQFLWSSEEMSNNGAEHSNLLMEILEIKLPRIVRCNEIVGLKDTIELTDEMTGGEIIIPCMQCVEIFLLKADICQLGMDERMVKFLVREYCRTIEGKKRPIILSYHMLPGLQQGQEKMSKSDTSSSIYMEDGEAEVNFKIEESYCPLQIVEGNPCLEYLKYIIFPWFNKIEVLRKPEEGGNKEYSSFDGLVEDYVSGALRPSDLKPALAKAINEILEPVRKHFETDRVAEGLLKAVKSYKVAE